MMRNFQITITPETIERWRKELEKINLQLKELLKRRDTLQSRIHYLDLYLEEPQQPGLPGLPVEPEKPPKPISDFKNGTQPINELSPPEAIRKILREAERPLAKNEIRERLKLAGYPMEKYRPDGGYFYTILGRMGKSGEVTLQGGKLVINK